MSKFLVIIEDTETAYSPDLPGCASTGATKDEVQENITEAIKFNWKE